MTEIHMETNEIQLKLRLSYLLFFDFMQIFRKTLGRAICESMHSKDQQLDWRTGQS